MPETGLDADEGQAGEGADALLGLMHGVVRSLASTTTLTEVLRVVVARGAHDFEPLTAALAWQQGRTLVEVARWGSPALLVGSAGDEATDTLDPWTDAIGLCEPVWVASADEWQTRYPDAPYGDDIASLAALPLVKNGAAYGVLVIGFANASVFDARARALLVLLADLCSLLLGRSDPADVFASTRRPRVELTLVDTNGATGASGSLDASSGRANGNGHAPTLGSHPRLTAREQQIALALTEGRRSSAVARDLGISIYTVRKHISAILRKYDVTSQSELIARIYRESARSG